MSDTPKNIEDMSDEELLEIGQVPGDEDFQLEDTNEPGSTLEDELMTVSTSARPSGSEEEAEAEEKAQGEENTDDEEQQQQEEETPSEETVAAGEAESEAGGEDEDTGGSTPGSESNSESGKVETAKQADGEELSDEGDVPQASDGNKDDEVTPEIVEQLKLKADAYDRVFAPFKANGRDLQVKNPEEAIQLMQMGANYTKKLQALQPHLKLVRMLENNGLADESKITYLIDLDRKNPEAIKKLVKDANIDPMDIDPNEEPNYTAGNYSVSDQQMVFDGVVQEVAETDEGRQVLRTVRGWDGQSKQTIYDNPSIIRTLKDHTESGIFGQIAEEVETQRTLGNIPREVPFLNAYHQVAEIMHKNGLLKRKDGQPVQAQQQQPVQQQTPPQNQGQAPGRQVLATRARSKQTTDPNAARARAAAPVNSAPKTPAQDFNPLAMSDDEIMKMSSTGVAMKL